MAKKNFNWQKKRPSYIAERVSYGLCNMIIFKLNSDYVVT